MAAKKAGAKKKTAPKKAAAKKKAPRAPAKNARPTLATISAQIAELAASLEAVRALLAARPGAATPAGSVDLASFEPELLSTLADLDRRGRHAGLVPIPEVRIAFLDRGWTRDVFDERLLQAERDFVVDLKTADDPTTLANPDLAIHEAGRGHLQYVVTR